MKHRDSTQVTWLDLCPLLHVRLSADIYFADGGLFAKAGSLVTARGIAARDMEVLIARVDGRTITASLRELQHGAPPQSAD